MLLKVVESKSAPFPQISIYARMYVKETIQAEFGNAFKGLGSLGDYHIILKEDATRSSITMFRSQYAMWSF